MFTIYDPKEQRWPIKVWLENRDQLDETCLQQAKNLSNLPFAREWIALMPDTHSGFGMPIGGVLATEGVLVPNAVGVDIGCGMMFLQTNVPVELLKRVDTPNGKLAQAMVGDILRNIPTGFEHYKKKQECKAVKEFEQKLTDRDRTGMAKLLIPELENGCYQIEGATTSLNFKLMKRDIWALWSIPDPATWAIKSAIFLMDGPRN